MSVDTVPPALPDGEDATVDRLIDGNTVRLTDGRSIRPIGVDSPESTVTRDGYAQCFGIEAAEYLEQLLPKGTNVRVVTDTDERDQYGRTLTYLYRVSDGLFVNHAVVANGYAEALTIPPNVAHADEFAALSSLPPPGEGRPGSPTRRRHVGCHLLS